MDKDVGDNDSKNNVVLFPVCGVPTFICNTNLHISWCAYVIALYQHLSSLAYSHCNDLTKLYDILHHSWCPCKCKSKCFNHFPNRHVLFIAYLPRQFQILMLKMGRFLRFAENSHQPQMSFER